MASKIEYASVYSLSHDLNARFREKNPAIREHIVTLDVGYDAAERVYRLTRNGAVPFDEACAEYDIQSLPNFDFARQVVVREREVAEFLAVYRARQQAAAAAGVWPSNEHRAEARAVHGPGVELVDVASGCRFTTCNSRRIEG